jgi:LacI family transcriptional regulator
MKVAAARMRGTNVAKRAEGQAGPVSLREVARLAGVDVSTASRALTGQRKVSAGALLRVNDAAATLGYTVNQAARNLRLSKTMILGIVINTFDTPFYLDALEGLGAACEESGYNLMITSARGDAAVYRLLMQRLFERRVDGLIMWRPPALDTALGPYLNAGVPVLAIGVPKDGSPPVPHVSSSEAGPIQDAVGRLAALGHRSMLYVKSSQSAGRVRLPVLAEAAASAGMRFEHREVARQATIDGFCTLLDERIRRPPGVTAVISDHHHLVSVVSALHRLELGVPGDVSLVSFARSRWAREMWMPMSTIQTDAVEFGRAIARLMVNWLAGSRPPSHSDVAVAQWVERGTHGPARPV